MKRAVTILLAIISAILLIVSFSKNDMLLSDMCRIVGFATLFLFSVLQINFKKKETRNFLITVLVMFLVQLAVFFLIAQKQGEVFNITNMVTNYIFIIFWGVYFGVYLLIKLICRAKASNEGETTI